MSELPRRRHAHKVQLHPGREFSVDFTGTFFDSLEVPDAIDGIWRAVVERVEDGNCTPMTIREMPRARLTLAAEVTMMKARAAFLDAGLLRSEGDGVVPTDPLWRAVARRRLIGEMMEHVEWWQRLSRRLER